MAGKSKQNLKQLVTSVKGREEEAHARLVLWQLPYSHTVQGPKPGEGVAHLGLIFSHKAIKTTP